MKSTASLLVLGVLWATLSTGLLAETRIPPKKEARMIGTWIGHDDCAVEYLRISLEANGTGSVKYLLGDGPLDSWIIQSWDVNGYTTNVKAVNTAPQGLPVKITLTSGNCFLTCSLEWGSSKREFKLVKEDVLLSSLNRLGTLSLKSAANSSTDTFEKVEKNESASESSTKP